MRILLAGIILTLSAVMLAPSAFGSSGVRAPDAKICKDCPFPMRVGENRWKMPNGHVEIEILKKKLPNRWEQIQVRLVDTRDGRILAEGISTQRIGRKTVQVEMVDLGGSPVQGFVRYLGLNQREIQVRFTCDACSIAGDLL